MNTLWAQRGLKGLAVLGTAVATMSMNGCASTAAVQELQDRVAIEQLIFGDYPRALDAANWKAYAECFTEDGILLAGGAPVQGRKAIEENFSKPRPRPAPAPGAAPAAPRAPSITKHVISNLTLKIHGDTASGQAYWETVASRDGGKTTVIAGAGNYVDELQKVNGQWKFKKREIVNPSRPAAATGATPPAT